MNFKKYKKLSFTVIALILLVGLIGCGSESSGSNADTTDGQSSSEPTKGGTLNVAYGSEPDTIDWMYTGASATRDVGWHIFESLFALDNDYKIRPMIAESYEISDDRTVYTIKLREGVTFHDGSEVTAHDAVASIERWRQVSSVGTIADKYIENVTANDDYTIEIELSAVYEALLSDMSAPKSALMIIPSEIAEEAGEQPLKPEQLIGTGPYKFEKWERGEEINLIRFDDYAAREETDWGGLSGKKEAYVDEIKFQIVKDPQVMVNGLKTGIYDYAQSISPDLYDVIESTPNIDPATYINGYATITPDKSEAPFDDLKVRQALNHALDKETIAEATYGNEAFYTLDGALFSPEQKELYSEEGTDEFLAYNKEKAKHLLAESDYNGEPIQIMYSNDNDNYKKISQIAKQQMEEVGFTVELVSYEWATYLEKWADPKNWDLVVIGWSTRFSPNELGMLIQDTSSSGWYNSDHWNDLLDDWATAETNEQKQEVLGGMNRTVYDELPFIKIANEILFDIKSDKIKDYDSWVGPRFWNIWKDE
ncbi:MAG TPA: ABC transporter substrate-binding protein [Candidatus Avamphibacillus sp.]|nr:ABC transporter substrate-binding protein [Candidatus Avamphibacillus sp.]